MFFHDNSQDAHFSTLNFPNLAHQTKQLPTTAKPVLQIRLALSSKLDLKPSAKLLDAACSAVTNSIDSFNPQNIANMLWTFAKLDLKPSAKLLEAASLAARKSIDRFKPQGIANMSGLLL